MAGENECSRMSYFSGPLTIIVIVQFPLEGMTFSPAWRRLKDSIMKFVLLDILTSSALIFHRLIKVKGRVTLLRAFDTIS